MFPNSILTFVTGIAHPHILTYTHKHAHTHTHTRSASFIRASTLPKTFFSFFLPSYVQYGMYHDIILLFLTHSQPSGFYLTSATSIETQKKQALRKRKTERLSCETVVLLLNIHTFVFFASASQIINHRPTVKNNPILLLFYFLFYLRTNILL